MTEREEREIKLLYRKWYMEETEKENRVKIKKEFTFTKVISVVVMFGYIVGVLSGASFIYIILRDYPEHAIAGLIAYYSFVSAPFIADIAVYHWKSKYEFGLKFPGTKKEGLEE